MTDPLAPFHRLLHQRCGLLFEGVAAAKLASALEDRRQQQRLPSLNAYFDFLRGDETEFHALLSLLTINESYFFREPEQLQFVLETLLPRRLHAVAEASRRPLRILSAGCASGEEPYSLAISLSEKYGPDWYRYVQIHAGDIDRAVLARARAGCFSAYAFRSDWPLARERHFLRKESCWELTAELRRWVHFAELNLLDPQPAAHWTEFDFIFCRNVLIYFDQPTRIRILRNLAAMLRPEGCLIVGSAETLANDIGVLPLVEESGQFYFMNPDSTAAEFSRQDSESGSPIGHMDATAPVSLASPELPAGRSSGRTDGASLVSSTSPASPEAPAFPPRPTSAISSRFEESAYGYTDSGVSLRSDLGTNSTGTPAPDLLARGDWNPAHVSAQDPAHVSAQDPAYVSAQDKRGNFSGDSFSRSRAPDLDTLRAMVADGQYEQAVPWLKECLAANPEEVRCLLQLAYLELNRQHWEAAADAAQRVLDSDTWNLDALMVLGLTAKGAGQHEQGIAYLRRIIYTQPACWPAHYHLAQLYRERGQGDRAKQACRRVLQLLASEPLVNPGFTVIPQDLSAAKIRFLCEHQLQIGNSGAGQDRRPFEPGQR